MTPYPIDTRSLVSRIEGLLIVRQSNLRVIDGPKLVDLVQQRLPQLCSELIDVDTHLDKLTAAQLTNETLMRAIQGRTARHVADIHTDIDFSLGRWTTRLLCQGEHKPSHQVLDLDPSAWSGLLAAHDKCLELYDVNIIVSDVNEVETVFRAALERHENADPIEIQAEADGCRRDSNGILAAFKRKCKEVSLRFDNFKTRVMDIVEGRKQYETHAYMDLFDQPVDWQKAVSTIHGLIREISHLKLSESEIDVVECERVYRSTLAAIRPAPSAHIQAADRLLLGGSKPRDGQVTIASELGEAADAVREFLDCMCELHEIIAPLEFPNYSVDASGEYLSKALQESRFTLKQDINEINEAGANLQHMSSFLHRWARILSAVSDILRDSAVLKLLGRAPGGARNESTSDFRLKVPLNRLLQTQENVAVLGTAGAGKTTSLQMYAANQLTATKNSVRPIFISVAQLIRTIFPDGADSHREYTLEECIWKVLVELGGAVARSDLDGMFQEGLVSLLLDGLDEGIGEAPWLLRAVKSFAEKYPHVQVVVSSRVSGQYVNDIPFIAVTLLPFTVEQRSEFAIRWFGPRGQAHVNKINDHLDVHPELDEIVRNPLLATLLFTLEENSVPLPRSETRLYSERMQLLLGGYDVHKQVRRVTCDRWTLERCARIAAWYLHVLGRRHASMNELCGVIVARTELAEDAARHHLEELVDPCNILVALTEMGDLGFDHLRYQEHLAAVELCTGHSRQITRILVSDWWYGAIILFAEMTDDIEWVISEASIAGVLSRASGVIRGMIKRRPEHERDRLWSVVQAEGQISQQDEFARILFEDDLPDEYFEMMRMVDLDPDEEDLIRRRRTRFDEDGLGP